jgi:hypothetical protein
MASTAFAGEIGQRKQNQQDRIGKGVTNGSLTPKETARLEHKEAHLNKQIRNDRQSGGGLSNAERRQINRKQDRLSHEIYNQKHDGQTQK